MAGIDNDISAETKTKNWFYTNTRTIATQTHDNFGLIFSHLDKFQPYQLREKKNKK